MRDAPADHPLAAAARLTLVKLGLDDPDWRVTVRSTIPIASGMGSGAAVSRRSCARLAEAANQRISKSADRQVGESANLQIAVRSSQFPDFRLWSTRSRSCITARPAASTTPSSSTASRSISCAGSRRSRSRSAGRSALAIADTGIRSPTKIAVGDVRRAWEREPDALRGAVRPNRDGGGGCSIGHRRGRSRSGWGR